MAPRTKKAAAATPTLTFLGGVGTVTGSKYLLRSKGAAVLIDCGLFQGFKQLRLRNWSPLPVDPKKIGAVVLTHAHLDHSGYLPLLVKNGFEGFVYATHATRDLCEILLPDSGFLQEKDAAFANKKGFSRHKPALPLYTKDDAMDALGRIRAVPFGEFREVAPGVRVRFRRAGHILGAAIVEATIDGRTVVFSGDLGRSDSATMPTPERVETADYVLIESTYGDRRHSTADPEDALAEVVNRVAARGGTVLVPSFAVGRTQILLYHIWRLKRSGRIPDLPVFLDSPMAIDAAEIFRRHADDHRLSPEDCRAMCAVARLVREPEDSQALDRDPMPKIIVSASGMATGGRVLHHLKHFAPDPRNAVLFAGYQAGGTRGRHMVDGAPTVKIHGRHVPIKAEVDNLDMLSAHADRDGLMAWLRGFRRPPKRTFVVHGEPEAADALRGQIEEELGWPVSVPDYRDEEPLD